MIAAALLILAGRAAEPPSPFVFQPARPVEIWLAVDDFDPGFRWQLHTLKQDLWRPFPTRFRSIPTVGLFRQLITLERRRQALHRLFHFRLITTERLADHRISSIGLPKYRIGRYGAWRRFPVHFGLCGTGKALAFFEAFADELYRDEIDAAYLDECRRIEFINHELAAEDGRTVAELSAHWRKYRPYPHWEYYLEDETPAAIPTPLAPRIRDYPIPWQINPPARPEPPPLPE